LCREFEKGLREEKEDMWPRTFWGRLRNRALRSLAWNGTQVGVVLAVGFFAFQTMQSWVDAGISKSHVRWILPLSSGLLVAIIFASVFLIRNMRNHKVQTSPVESLALSILGYGRQLHMEGRDQALVNLRNHFSLTLHILGFHQIRTQLGELALQSAAIIRDTETKCEILVDDLGWANHLLGHTDTAIKNIERGIQVARDTKSNKAINLVRLSLCEAKGLRHLAVAMYNKVSLQEANARLDEALQVLHSLPEQSMLEVKRDIGQIHHARALIIAMICNIHKLGTIRDGDVEGIKHIDTALTHLRQSVTIFREIGDLERYTKALFLEVRLLEAKKADTEAREVRALRDRTLAVSEWMRPEGTSTLTGV
jgi:hypothetical protein